MPSPHCSSPDSVDFMALVFPGGPVATILRRCEIHTPLRIMTDRRRVATLSPLEKHVRRLRACRRCDLMHRPVVSGGPVQSKVLLIGQAPGDKEPILGRPFAWTAGKTLFRWFAESTGISEEQFRARVYMAAVCRCFPGKKATGGDRVPTLEEISNCGAWLEAEFALLKPSLVIPVGKLAIAQFLAQPRLDRVIGRQFQACGFGLRFDLIPLPHPSGASPWHRMEPGRSLLNEALGRIAIHPAYAALTSPESRATTPRDRRRAAPAS